jgi:putative RNA 2'-phosphotransferase
MTNKETIKMSKFLSLILRHEPERVGLKLGEAGWVAVDDLLQAVNRHDVPLTLDQVQHIVATSDKKRFAFSEDGLRIRASQGHSVDVDLQYPPQTPPETLYHGTATRFLDSIRQHGLQKMDRHDVHLSAETKITIQVGGRHGKPVLLTIRAGAMPREGFVFRCSANGVWQVDHVPTQFIDFPAAELSHPDGRNISSQAKRSYPLPSDGRGAGGEGNSEFQR